MPTDKYFYQFKNIQTVADSRCLHIYAVPLNMAKKLHYFNLNALAEPIRYILHYTKQEFEDIRHDHESWPKPEVKESKFFFNYFIKLMIWSTMPLPCLETPFQ